MTSKYSIIFILTILMINSGNKIFAWSNWAGNQHCNPQEIFYPKNKQEIVRFIKQNQNSKIRPLGSGHSWSDLVCDNAVKLINISKLNKVVAIDKNKRLVKVQAGITLETLNKFLNEHNMALPNQTAIMEQTLAGTISTATHGTGKMGTFSSFVKAIEIIDGTGKVRVLYPYQNIYRSVTTSIGSLGIIYSITIDIVDQFYLKESNLNLSKQEFLQKYKELYKNHDFMQFTWYSQKPVVSVQLFDKVNPQDKFKNLDAPVSFEALSSYSTGGKRLEEEISIPEDDFKNAIIDTENLINNYKVQNSYFMVPDIFCRFVKADNNNLSMTTGRDSIFLSISTPVDSKYLDFYKRFESILLKYNGRPHWGKINFLDYNKVLKLYGSNFSDFIKAKKELDSNNVFENSYTKQLFNPTS